MVFENLDIDFSAIFERVWEVIKWIVYQIGLALSGIPEPLKWVFTGIFITIALILFFWFLRNRESWRHVH